MELSARPYLAESGEPVSGRIGRQGNPFSFGKGEAGEAESVERHRFEIEDLKVVVPCSQTDDTDLGILAFRAKRLFRLVRVGGLPGAGGAIVTGGR